MFSAFNQSLKPRVGSIIRNRDGAVAIEFVLIAPILFALLFGIITVGYFLGISHSVHQLATSAARVSVAGLNGTERAALAQDYINEASSHYPLLTQSAITPAITVVDTGVPSITVNVTYALDGSLLELANGFLRLGLTDLTGRAYVAY
ncbi:TadE/TadG family type IV pilus assembly protein [Loktanella sp. 3ANDIMAR09]|uniref:TadE/TadG family type IV pilus assembly protein n=1 Tax=Loktanella sp. 3ANDIMAR09 TaxID=1225657 RepID=UPI0009F8802D|nr:TadE/TadG family type IV pilus assembly protein [Loktanella sp. 3ANDIMAR09]